MKIGILTGGGDVPGLNPAIKAVVYRATDAVHEVVGIRRGWAGLLNINPDDPKTLEQNLTILNKNTTRTIDRTGGTILHTSRTNPGKVSIKNIPDFLINGINPGSEKTVDLTHHILSVLQHLKMDALIAIGGDDTLSYAVCIHEQGFPVVAIPKTMDNDVFGTDYCIGFSTAVTRSVDFIDALRTPAGSHERIAVVELFGRYSGETSLISAYLTNADRAIISEVDFDIEKLSRMIDGDKKSNPSGYAIITISEGAKMTGGSMVISGEPDAYGHQKLGGIGYVVTQEIQKRTGHIPIYQQVAYLMRSGEPDALDRMVSTSYGYLAADLINLKNFGRMVSIQEGKYTTVAIDIISKGQKRVDVAELYDSENYKPRIRHFLNKPMFLY
jgi:ATP-dependent phosphofructokinase / diphosphate-dependent phosphofructokinase